MINMTMELKNIPIDKIHANPFQPRERFENESLFELADSMKDSNIIQPIIVRKDGLGYRIVAGERRWRAAQMAGLKVVPCIIKEIPEERILLESLIENLHRLDLSDPERENAIHELWGKRDVLNFQTKADMARAIGARPQAIEDDLEAWEFRQKEKEEGAIAPSAPTYIISSTKGLDFEDRKKVIAKIERGEMLAKEVWTAVKVIKKAPEPIKKELLKEKSIITPKMAETIVEKLPDEEEQSIVLEEIKHERLTEDEVTARAIEMQRAKERAEPLRKEMGVQEGTSYTVGEYECPHCKKHYLIKCNGKRDWVE